MGETGLPIVCFDARALSCPLDAEGKRRMQRESPYRKGGTRKLYTKIMGWHLYYWNGETWIHYVDKCSCSKPRRYAT